MVARVILTISDGKRAGERHEIVARGEWAIGRAENCGVQLSGDDLECLTVSRRHCLVEFDPPRARIRDLGSRNGTYINGMQIGRPEHWHFPAKYSDAPFQTYELRNGDELRVGSTVFQVAICENSDEDDTVFSNSGNMPIS